jgi:hypothetical protein
MIKVYYIYINCNVIKCLGNFFFWEATCFFFNRRIRFCYINHFIYLKVILESHSNKKSYLKVIVVIKDIYKLNFLSD